MERKNIEEFLEIILIVHAQRSSVRCFEATNSKIVHPKIHSVFSPVTLVSSNEIVFKTYVLTYYPFLRLPPFPLFLPQNSRDIRVTSHGSLTGALPLKPLPPPFTRFLLLSHSSIYSYSFSDLSLPDFDGNETSFQWHLLFVDRAKNSLPIFPIILPCEIAKPIRFVILNMCF